MQILSYFHAFQKLYVLVASIIESIDTFLMQKATLFMMVLMEKVFFIQSKTLNGTISMFDIVASHLRTFSKRLFPTIRNVATRFFFE